MLFIFGVWWVDSVYRSTAECLIGKLEEVCDFTASIDLFQLNGPNSNDWNSVVN